MVPGWRETVAPTLLKRRQTRERLPGFQGGQSHACNRAAAVSALYQPRAAGSRAALCAPRVRLGVCVPEDRSSCDPGTGMAGRLS